MANEEEYEIMPHSKLDKLKEDVEELKKGPSKEMHESMNDLKGSIDKMIDLFRVAAEEMKTERIQEEGVEKRLGPVLQKLDKIAQQQNQLANGMVAIADMIKEHFPRIEHDIERIQRMSPEMLKKKFTPMPPVQPMRPRPVPMPPPAFEPKPLPPLEPPQGMRSANFPPFPGDEMFPEERPPQRPSMPPPPQFGMPPPPPGMGQMPQLEPLGPPPFEERQKKKGLLGGFFKK